MSSGSSPVPPRLLQEQERLSWLVRLTALLSGALLLALLVTARCLTPSPSGSGTHQQLGLPPCTAVLMFDRPCPACGMTTSWAHTMRGNLVAAAGANSGGMLLALIALAFLPASCYFFFRGKATRGHWFSLVLAICLITALGAALIQWVYRLMT